MITIVGVDPGLVYSAVVAVTPDPDGAAKITPLGFPANRDITTLGWVFESWAALLGDGLALRIFIEGIQSYGYVTGRDVIDTVRWIGRMEQRFLDLGWEVTVVPRPEIKSCVAGRASADDATVRRALINRLGGVRKGDPLFGVTKDMWQALAVAMYGLDSLLRRSSVSHDDNASQ